MASVARGYRGSRYAKNMFEDYFHRHEKTYFPVNKNQIRLILYKGKITDSYQIQSYQRTQKWKDFFDKSIYKKFITSEYYDSPGLPLGVVYNHRKNEIKTFECHLELDEYFRDNYN